MTIANMLDNHRVVLVCGTGGVGKTSMSVALGVVAARDLGKRVIVLTVDPARRLASALGFGGDASSFHDGVAVTVPGPSAHAGSLTAAMLDPARAWDELIERSAPTSEVRDNTLRNPLYRNLTRRFVQSHNYAAIERLYELAQSEAYDLVIVDTPPSRHALDILDAPQQMREFFGGRLLKWLTVPTRSRLFTVASKPFYQVADRILGDRFLQDITEFFTLFQTMEAGFSRRAGDVEAILRNAGTTAAVVTTLEGPSLAESRRLVDELQRRGIRRSALIVNRVLPEALADPGVAAAATAIDELGLRAVSTIARAAGLDRDTAQRVLQRTADQAAATHVRAVDDQRRLAELRAEMSGVVWVPLVDHTLSSAEALGELGGFLHAQ